ncbi:polysaccharide deacetylase family protein [Nautilia lithotrophica]
MKQAINTYSLKKNKINLLQVIIAFLIIILISGYIFYQLIPKNENNFLFFTKKPSKVYILLSEENEIYLNKINLSIDAYEDKLKQLQKKFSSIGINTKTITENDIDSLNKNDILIAFDIYSVSKNTMQKIKDFLNRGGNFIFNYHFGYFLDSKFVKAENIENITGLKYFTESKSKSSSNFYTPKILSPLLLGSNGQRHDLVLYSNDTLPLFKSKYIPDAILTNWEITSTPILENKMLDIKESGIIWHGFYSKGKWFYFSFPSYVILDMPKELFKKYFNNIINFMTGITIAKYPFLDSKNAVFISEDTEYKYTNMINFSILANKYNIPATLFCVANLALKHPDITKKASDLPNIEIGSHSYTHTKIQGEPEKKVLKEIKGSKEVLEKITGKKVFGFRPPREEIDQTMENILRESGYKYVMEKTKPYLLPTFEHKKLITIPRHGTDDYIYLMNLNWNKNKILQKIIQETEMLTALNAIYTLSVHTHLLSYKSNLDVSKRYFEFLTKNKKIRPFKGIEIANRIEWKKNISVSLQTLNGKIFIYINNKNKINIKNFSFRIYWPNANKISISPEMSNVKIKIIENNLNRKYTDISINLKPKSTISLIVNENE